MKSENFIYWLQGYLELTDKQDLTALQVVKIRQHLKLVLVIEHNFIYWLQGYLLDRQDLTALQVVKIRQEIGTVLHHVSDNVVLDEIPSTIETEGDHSSKGPLPHFCKTFKPKQMLCAKTSPSFYEDTHDLLFC